MRKLLGVPRLFGEEAKAHPRGPAPSANGGPSSEPSRRRALRSMLSELVSPLQIIDVGCRWGPEDVWQALQPHVAITGFDPDPEECRRLTEQFGRNLDLEFIPLALGAATGKYTLHLAAEAACSSFYPPHQSTIGERPALALASPAGKTEVEVTTLDEWLEARNHPCVDFMKIDTQGSELDVLRGSRRALSSMRALQVEVEFNPIYSGQPLFGDVDAFLRENGFVLWRFANMVHYGLGEGLSRFSRKESQYFDDRPVEFTAEGGQVFWAEASYVARDLSFPPAEAGKPSVRDACLLGALGFWDLAGRLDERLRIRDGRP